MKPASSLRFRLMAANVLVKQVVILLAAVFLLHQFDKLMHREAAAELEAIARALMPNAALLQAGGKDVAPAPVDGGAGEPAQREARYWQIWRGGEVIARSASLDGRSLALPSELHLAEKARAFSLKGPDGQDLFASGFVEAASNDGAPLQVVVARSAADLDALWREFRNAVVIALGGIAALLLTSAWIQVNVGLRPAELLRSSIERVRLGRARRLEAKFPDELMPLINETNRLLEAQENAMSAARARAGDLAHGLKTPLAAVTALAEQLHDAGERRLSGEILKNVELASRHVERELARTRIAAASGMSYATPVRSVLERLRATMRRLPRGAELEWEIEAAPEVQVAVDEADMIEIVAPLLDNARKWASMTIHIAVVEAVGRVEMAVEDDGPGVAESDYAQVLRRGIRLDESMPGTGLGLTIAKDVAEAYGGSIGLYRARAGGLGVRLVLPPAARGAGARAGTRLGDARVFSFPQRRSMRAVDAHLKSPE